MPLEAFEHLNPDKKQKLIHAAIREFSDNPYERVSVFNIAKNAEISRSGFYYYFVDKEDVYGYLLEQLCTAFERELDGGCSVLELHRVVFDFFARYKGTEQQNLIFRVIENMKPSVQSVFASSISHPKFHPCLQLRDTEKLKTFGEKDNNFFGFMTISCTVHALRAYYETDEPVESIRARLDRSMDFIKFGVVKEEFR